MNWRVFFLLMLPFVAFGQKCGPLHVYQYEVKVGSRPAYLWLPPRATHIRGVIISLANLLERQWLEDSTIRATAAAMKLGIIWIGPGERGDHTLTADMKSDMKGAFIQMMRDMARVSGYPELETAPVIPMGHSANGHFAWTFAAAFPERTIACIPVKTVPLPDSMEFKGIPLCYIMGETTEWPQFRVPDTETKPGDRDYFWPVVRESAVRLRKDPGNLVGVVIDPGGGHFDWSPRLSRFVALYIRKACAFRLPRKSGAPLRSIRATKGWLTDTRGMKPDLYRAAPYTSYLGDRKSSYWFFDRETAEAAIALSGDRRPRKKQMITFVQDGKKLDVSKLGYAPLQFLPDSDGITLRFRAGFLDSIPPGLVGAGKSLGHTRGSVRLSLIAGPLMQTGPEKFRLQGDRSGITGDAWMLVEQNGDQQYRHAVQPGKLTIPRLEAGTPQHLSFDMPAQVKRSTKKLILNGTADSGLQVNYFVKSGPAYVKGDTLIFTRIPVKSRYPVKVTLVAYQYGRAKHPAVRSAEPVETAFNLIK